MQKHRGGTRDHHRWFDYRADDFNAVNRLMISRKIDATVADFLLH